jgi:3'-phosphoadenosine 5'-phosphosulfate (PAPS) 3'-phosphatase
MLYPGLRIVCQDVEKDKDQNLLIGKLQADKLAIQPEKLRLLRRDLPVTAQMHRTKAKERTVQMERFKLELQTTFGEDCHDMVDPGYMQMELQYEDVILWIDPIDCRKTFKSNPFDITTIVGISVKGRPKAGIIYKPFYDKGFGRTFVGTVESGCFQYDVARDNFAMSAATYLPPNTQTVSYPLRLIESSDEVSQKYNTPLYQTFDNVEIKEQRGVGSTLCDMIESKGDLHLNFVPDYHGWDICGPAALLMSRLGYCADSKGLPLTFNADRNQY